MKSAAQGDLTVRGGLFGSPTNIAAARNITPIPILKRIADGLVGG